MTDSTTPPVIQTFSPLVAPTVQPYQSYLPTAFSDDLSLLQKVNMVLNYLNTVTTTVNNALTQMNSVETWALGTGLQTDVDNQLTTWMNDGTLNTIINQNVFNDLNTQISDVEQSLGVILEYQFPKQTGDTCDVERINRAISYAQSNNISRIVFAPKIYDVSKGTITTNGLPIELMGTFASYFDSTTNNRGATILNANGSTVSTPVIDCSVAYPNVIPMLKLTNLVILGSTSWDDSNQANWANRVALNTQNVARELMIENVMIMGFKQGGWTALNTEDGTIKGLVIMYCGTDGSYPALYLTGDSNNHSNALHFFGLHIEQCPYQLKIDKNSRHIQFIGSKFEVGLTTSNPAIVINSDALEVLFTGCQFVNGVGSSQPYLFSIANSLTKIISSMFASPTSQGSKYIDASGGFGGLFESNSFFYSLGTTYGVLLGNNMLFRGNDFWVDADSSGNKNGIQCGSENIVVDNLIHSDTDLSTPTTGNLFNVTGTGNRLKNKIVNCTYVTDYNFAQNLNTLEPSSALYTQLTVNSATPKLNAANNFYYCNNTATTVITDFSGAKLIGREIMIIGRDAFTTIQNQTYIQTKSGSDITLSAGTIAHFIFADQGNGAKWHEI